MTFVSGEFLLSWIKIPQFGNHNSYKYTRNIFLVYVKLSLRRQIALSYGTVHTHKGVHVRAVRELGFSVGTLMEVDEQCGPNGDFLTVKLPYSEEGPDTKQFR